ncbi:MAG TPA: DinB family protein [Acidimicrobiales bacterium]
MEACEVCGFVWESVPADEVAARISTGVAGVVRAILEAESVVQRPTPERWSQLEYAAHVRDVLLHVRDRIVIALVEDNPSFKPLYRDERVDRGLYAGDTVESVIEGLTVAVALFIQTFLALDDGQLARPCQYVYPTAQTRSLLWVGQQVVHEVEHHAGDIAENAQLLAG